MKTTFVTGTHLDVSTVEIDFDENKKVKNTFRKVGSSLVFQREHSDTSEPTEDAIRRMKQEGIRTDRIVVE